MLLTRPGVLLRDRYLLRQRIGSGGMGEVWRADDTALGRAVALKVLHPALADDEGFRRRFQQEARTVAALGAPGVVDVYDICADRQPDGGVAVFLVMEFVEGLSLAEVLARQAPLPPHRALPLLARVADALDAAHRAGVIHRDIKPANIIVDGEGVPTILDFGIAVRPDQTSLTATGTVLGTVGYASPEQLSDGDLTGASDLYSLGIVAYECLSGRIPFDRSSPAAVITGHLHEAPPPLPPSVPAAAARLVEQTLAKDPAQRPASAAVFARACREAAAAAPATDRTTVDMVVRSTPSRPTAPVSQAGASTAPMRANGKRRKRRGRVVLLGILAVIAAAALTVGAMRYVSGPDEDGANEDDPVVADPESESTESATETETGEEDSEEPPENPSDSVLVSAGTGDCLVGYYDSPPPSAAMEPCDGEGIETYEFRTYDGPVRMTYPDSLSSSGTGCIEWDGDFINATGGCDGTTWEFTYLGTDEADGSEGSEDADIWQIRATGDGSYCLTVEAEAPTLAPCTDGDVDQQWRTVAA